MFEMFDEDLFQQRIDISKNSKYWVTKDNKILEIKDMDLNHLKNVDKMFHTMFYRLIRVKFWKILKSLGEAK